MATARAATEGRPYSCCSSGAFDEVALLLQVYVHIELISQQVADVLFCRVNQTKHVGNDGI